MWDGGGARGWGWGGVGTWGSERASGEGAGSGTEGALPGCPTDDARCNEDDVRCIEEVQVSVGEGSERETLNDTQARYRIGPRTEVIVYLLL